MAIARSGGAGRGGHRNAVGLLGVLLLGVGLLAACGSSSKSTTSPASKPPAAATPLTIALPVAEPVQSPVYLADKLGYFKKNGLDVKVIVLPSDTADNAALVAGSVQYTSVNAVSLISANEKGVPLQMICMEYDGPEWALAVSQSVISSTHISKSMPLKQILAALHGQKIAIVGTAASAPGLMLTGLFKYEGLSPSSVSLIGVSASADLGSAFSHGEVGAVFDTQPIPDRLVQQTPGQVVFDTTELPSLAHIPWEGILGTRSYISAHPAIDKAVCRAIGEADNYLLDNTAAAVRELQSTFPSISPTLLKDALQSYKWAPGGKMTSSQWTEGVTALSSFGLLPAAPPQSLIAKVYSTAYLP